MKASWQRVLVSAGAGFVLACGCTSAAKEDRNWYWFGDAYRSDVRFTVMARQFAKPESNRPRRFVFLADGLSQQIQHENTPSLNSDDLRKVVSGQLQRQGFVPAQSTEEAEVAVVVAYGRGYYPPPFAFAGVSMRTSERDWPPALREYRNLFAPVWLQNEDTSSSGGMTAAWIAQITSDAPRAIADQVNLITIRAYDWHVLQHERQLRLLWETRVTTPARSRPLETYAAAMLATASDHFDRNVPHGIVRRANELRGEVKLGPLKSFGEVDQTIVITSAAPADQTPLRGNDVRTLR